MILILIIGMLALRGDCQSISATITLTSSITGSGSITGSSSGSVSATGSNTGSLSGTGSSTGSTSGTPSGTFPLPTPPANLVNVCLRPDGSAHQTYLCPGWTDTSGRGFQYKIVATAGGVSNQPIFVNTLFAVLFPLTPGTSYTIQIYTIDAQGRTSLPLTGTLTTSPTDARTAYKTKDLQNPTCVAVLNPTNFRSAINCTWGPPPSPNPQPSKIEVEARCISAGQHNRRLSRVLVGTATNVTLNIARTSTVCHIEIDAFYTNHAHTHGRGHTFTFTVTINAKPSH